MTQKKIKMHEGEGEKPESAEVDRLSELPDEIIHHILSYVPTVDAVRMSILSKRWRRMWYSLPILSFSDSADFGNSKSVKLCKFVGKCFRLRKNDLLNVTDTVITKVELSTSYNWRSRIFCWLRLVAKSNIKELYFKILRRHSIYFPPEVLCSRSLTHMRLGGVALMNLHSASLPSLKSLSLEFVSLGDQVLHNLLLGCCSLEKLLLKHCSCLSTPKISSLSIKFLETDFDHERNKEMFQVEAINLESFVCRGSRTCSMSTILSCPKLRNLSFYGSVLDGQWLEDLILRLPVLESLTIENCNELRHVKICSQHLKHIILKVDASLCDGSDVTIDSPNLVSFQFEGSPSLKLSINVKNLLEANVRLSPISFRSWICKSALAYDLSWYTNVLNFLSSLDCSKNIVLSVCSEEALIFPDDLQRVPDAPLPTVKHLKVTTNGPLSRKSDMQHSLFWALPSLETLRIDTRAR